MAETPTLKMPLAFIVGDKQVDGITIAPALFARWVQFITEANTLKQPATFEARLRRVRMLRQVTYYLNGVAVPLGAADISQMPIAVARELIDKLETDPIDKAGKVIRPGDGIDKAIGFELGTPIGSRGQKPITELEFMAKTYGEIEDVLAAGDMMSQTMLLITTVAKPVHPSLTLLPSWAIDQIGVSDGFEIARQVLPSFLGSASE